MRNTFPHIFWPHLKSGILVVFRVWRSTGSFRRNLSFQCTQAKIRIHTLQDWLTHSIRMRILQDYKNTRLQDWPILNKLFTLKMSECGQNHVITYTNVPSSVESIIKQECVRFDSLYLLTG